MTVYLDNNATTPLKDGVKAAMSKALEVYGNPSSVHACGREARVMLDTARRNVAAMFGVRSEQVIFTSSGTEANNLVLRGYFSCPEHMKKKLVISSVEHNCVHKTAVELNRVHGVPMHMLPVDRDGIIDLEDLKQTLEGGNVGLVSIMHGNNETGVIQPLAEIVKLCKEAGVRVHTDAVQTAGKLPLSFAEMGVDMMTVSFHKLGGPKGVGAVIMKADIEMECHTSGGSQERNRRAGTENLIGIAGAGACTEEWQVTVDKMQNQVGPLRDKLEKGLQRLGNDLYIIGQNAQRVPNTTNVIVPGLVGEDAVIALDMAGFCVSTGSACSSGRVEPSRVILAHGFPTDDALCALRISLGWQTTESDVDAFLVAFGDMLGRMRKAS